MGLYGGPLRDCVVALKYHGRHRTAERLAVRMMDDDRCRALFEKADLAIPVPLHPGRLGTRGFNQADLLATALARGVRIARADVLTRVRDTPSQTNLSVGERRRNVRNAFKAKQSTALSGAIVVLVDDVMTTGATLRECASTLLTSGVREVRSITVARAE
ncbi:MAG: ComF family protein [Vicinamibacteria bacterium]